MIWTNYALSFPTSITPVHAIIRDSTERKPHLVFQLPSVLLVTFTSGTLTAKIAKESPVSLSQSHNFWNSNTARIQALRKNGQPMMQSDYSAHEQPSSSAVHPGCYPIWRTQNKLTEVFRLATIRPWKNAWIEIMAIGLNAWKNGKNFNVPVLRIRGDLRSIALQQFILEHK